MPFANCVDCVPHAHGLCTNWPRVQLPLTSLSAVSVDRDSATLSPGSQCSFCQSTRDELVRLREEVMVLKATVLRLSEAESLRVAKTIPGSNEGSRRPRKRVYEFAGLEPRIGLLEWTTGVDYWISGATNVAACTHV